MQDFSIKFLKQGVKYLQIAEIIGSFSIATRRKVGAVIVSAQGKIVGTGFNGAPSGVDNRCEDQLNETFDHVIHAELNAIFNATTHDLKGATVFITDAPCIRCAAAIKQKQFNAVFYTKPYRLTEGQEFLRSNGIPVMSVDELLNQIRIFELLN